jgi:hypothetical protein
MVGLVSLLFIHHPTEEEERDKDLEKRRGKVGRIDGTENCVLGM